MRSIINIVLIVLVAVVGYNYFFGSTEEKTASKEIVSQVKDLGKSIGGLITSEKERIEEGKYDSVFDKIEDIFNMLESQLDSGDAKDNEELKELEKNKKELEEEVKNAEEQEVTKEEKNNLEDKVKELLEKTEKLLDKSNE